MWEMIGKVLTGNNSTPIIIFLLIFTVLFIFSVKKRIISINKGGVRIGSDERELTIVRNQTQWAHLFLLSLKGQLITMEDPIREDYFAELVLEKIYDKVVEWITYNHINDKKTYIEIKQSEVKCIVYALPVQKQYKTPEFESRMNEWTKEIIMNLINIRKEYSI